MLQPLAAGMRHFMHKLPIKTDCALHNCFIGKCVLGIFIIYQRYPASRFICFKFPAVEYSRKWKFFCTSQAVFMHKQMKM